MSAGKRRHKVQVLDYTAAKDALGGESKSWGVSFTAWAEFIYQRGDVATEGARNAGRYSVKVRLRASSNAKAIQPEQRLKHVRTGEVFEVQQVDQITQKADVFLLVEGPLSEGAGGV